ncbi:MAG TPA: hypothetical protein VIL46_05820 [Gemmataceae bacterium]
MTRQNRRAFLADVGRGMLIASVGPALAADLGLASAADGEDDGRLTFGKLEPLAGLMQDTPAAKLLPALVERIEGGTELRTLVAAAALANARTFGGEDYTGYHAFMALAPAFQMAGELAGRRQALPVLKVLYRNASRIQEVGGRGAEKLHPVGPGEAPDRGDGEALREATRAADYDRAEGTFAALARGKAEKAFNALQYPVRDEPDVHRVVLAWRAWDVLDLTGREHAHTLLRQSVRYCVKAEVDRKNRNRPASPVRTVLPSLLDRYRLLDGKPGTREADDAWVARTCHTVLTSDREQAAEAVAAALAEGFRPADVMEAIALAANQLVLRDPGQQRESPGKPKGSVHGASVGVHASDAANAWRNIARVVDHRNAVASLIVAAYHTAGQIGLAGMQPYPWAEHLEKVDGKDKGRLLAELKSAVEAREQALACAVVQRYAEAGHSEVPVFELLLRYALSEDGALHAEKYYRTVREEFAETRPVFRWRHLVALARVTASQYGHPAPGYEESCRLLKV